MSWGELEPTREKEEYRDELIESFKQPILKEVRKRDFIPLNLLRTKLWLYYKTSEKVKIRNITPSWFYIKDALEKLEWENKIEIKGFEFDNNQYARWVILKKVIDTDKKIVDRLEDKKERQLEIKKEIGRSSETLGKHNEKLIKKTLLENGYNASRGNEYCKKEGGKIEIDVEAHKRGKTIFIESKNRYSECYYHPEIGGKDKSTYKDLIDFFDFSEQSGAIPVLWASLVDKSFHSFVKEYDGYFFRQFFQYYPPEKQDLVNKIKSEFDLGHVKCIEEPTEVMINWIDFRL